MASPPPAPTTPVRALFLDVPLLNYSGITQVLYKLALHRPGGQLVMRVACLDTPQKTMAAAFEAAGVPVTHVGNTSIMTSARAVRAVMNEHGTEVVVANSFRAYLVAKAAVLGRGTPVVLWIHTINQLLRGRVRRVIFPLLARRDALISVSQAVRDNNVPSGHRGENDVIYNAVDAPDANPEWAPYPAERRADLNVPADAIVLAYTASFVYYKDHATLLAAFDRLARQDARYHLLLIGDGPDRERVAAQVRQLAAHDRVQILGSRHDARALLGLADVYVHAAHEEAFGLAVVEAMLAQRPIVAARAFALPELIRDGETGLLFTPHDVDDLVAKITTVVEDRPHAERLARAARQDGLRRFPPAPFAAHVTAFLQGVVHTRRQRTQRVGTRSLA